MQNKLIKINNKILESNLTPKERKKHLLIKKILEDKKCFFKMKITSSYQLLRDLKIKEEYLEKIYKELIDFNSFESIN